jgi:hypothetical protein
MVSDPAGDVLAFGSLGWRGAGIVDRVRLLSLTDVPWEPCDVAPAGLFGDVEPFSLGPLEPWVPVDPRDAPPEIPPDVFECPLLPRLPCVPADPCRPGPPCEPPEWPRCVDRAAGCVTCFVRRTAPVGAGAAGVVAVVEIV